jgi:hypothetical protein
MSAAMPRDSIVRASWLVTAVLVVTSGIAVLVPATRRAVAVADLVLFGVGGVAMLAAFARAVDRSRTELVSVPGVFFLAEGAAPLGIRRHLRASAALQVVAAITAASLRPYTAVAFGILVPMFGLGMIGLWGARYGTFLARDVGRRLGPARAAEPGPAGDERSPT